MLSPQVKLNKSIWWSQGKLTKNSRDNIEVNTNPTRILVTFHNSEMHFIYIFIERFIFFFSSQLLLIR